VVEEDDDDDDDTGVVVDEDGSEGVVVVNANGEVVDEGRLRLGEEVGTLGEVDGSCGEGVGVSL
jgi:hypothetical protein